LRGSPGKLVHFLFSPNGRSLAAYWDVPKGTLNFHYSAKAAVWDLQRRAPATQIPLGLPLAFSPDGSALLLDADGPLLTLDVASGQPRMLAEKFPYDRKFETPYPDLVAFARGDNLTFWNLTSGTPALPPFVLPRSKDMYASSLVFSADQRVAALVAIDEVFLWDVASRQQLGATSRKSSAFSRLAFGGYARGVVNSNGSVMAWVAGGGNSSNFDLTIWDVTRARVIGSFGPKRADILPAVAISPDGTIVVAHGLGSGILVFRLPPDGSVVEPLVLSPDWGKRKSKDGPSGLVFGPNGRVLAAYASGALDLWDMTDPAPRPLSQLPASKELAAADSGVLIVPTDGGTTVVDLAAPDKATSPIVMPGLTGAVSCAAGCRVFASISYSKASNVTTIRLRNLASPLPRR
jgi:WD40 repeat protein